MYSRMFIRELFKPQALYSSHSTRQIFDRLAHSSIMRLNKNSMDKVCFRLSGCVRGSTLTTCGSCMI